MRVLIDTIESFSAPTTTATQQTTSQTTNTTNNENAAQSALTALTVFSSLPTQTTKQTEQKRAETQQTQTNRRAVVCASVWSVRKIYKQTHNANTRHTALLYAIEMAKQGAGSVASAYARFVSDLVSASHFVHLPFEQQLLLLTGKNTHTSTENEQQQQQNEFSLASDNPLRYVLLLCCC